MAYISMLDLIYPVGSYYINANGYGLDTTATIIAKFGGTWEKMSDGYCLRSGSSNGTGGADTVTLTASQIPNHQHAITVMHNSHMDNSSENHVVYGTDYHSGGDGTLATDLSGGGGGSHNNIPVYQTVQVWKRTA